MKLLKSLLSLGAVAGTQDYAGFASAARQACISKSSWQSDRTDSGNDHSQRNVRLENGWKSRVDKPRTHGAPRQVIGK